MSIEFNESKHNRQGQAARVRAERTGAGAFIRLHSDENPYGCSLRVPETLGASDRYSLPADPVGSDLRAALSAYTGFSPERIVVGAGTVELIERMFHAFLEPGDALTTCPPSLPHHNPAASRARVSLVQVPRNNRFEIDP